MNDEHQMKSLLTDQYGGLCSTEFEKFLEENNIGRVITSVDNPSSNGLNERLNQTLLVNRIRCRMNGSEKKRAWTSIAH